MYLYLTTWKQCTYNLIIEHRSEPSIKHQPSQNNGFLVNGLAVGTGNLFVIDFVSNNNTSSYQQKQDQQGLDKFDSWFAFCFGVLLVKMKGDNRRKCILLLKLHHLDCHKRKEWRGDASSNAHMVGNGKGCRGQDTCHRRSVDRVGLAGPGVMLLAGWSIFDEEKEPGEFPAFCVRRQEVQLLYWFR
jgi:hypothetical protein